MNLIKHLQFFDPLNDIGDTPIHVIGCGAIGSFVAEMLARIGISELHLYDFDTVEDTNIANQLYTHSDIGKKKTDALALKLKEINPDITICPNEKWTPENNALRGYVFMCVDSVKTRQDIIKANRFNSNIIAVLDFRMNLKDAQHYAALWTSDLDKEKLVKSMDFTDAEVKEIMPVSACGTTLSIAPTVHTVVAAGISNFINIVKKENYATLIMVNPFTGQTVYISAK